MYNKNLDFYLVYFYSAILVVPKFLTSLLKLVLYVFYQVCFFPHYFHHHPFLNQIMYVEGT